MNNLKQKIKYCSALALMIVVSMGLNTAYAESADGNNAQHSTKNLNISGLYLGFFPCGDCHGIKTTLALNKNGTYVYITQYVGKSDREFVEKGKFALTDNGDKLILTPKKGSTTEQQYLIDDNMLVKLDEKGDRITSDGADRYILRRKDVISSQQKHTGH